MTLKDAAARFRLEPFELRDLLLGLEVEHASLGVGKIAQVRNDLEVRFPGQYSPKHVELEIGIEAFCRLPDRSERLRAVFNRRREVTEKLRAARDARDKLDPVLELISELQKQLKRHMLHAIPLCDDDRLLVHEWMASESQSDGNHARLLSARIAEVALARHLSQLALTVEDCSIKQVTDPAHADWKKFDLLVNSEPWDVKNARRSRHNSESFVHHCVPRFKMDRRGSEVHIAGVLSDYKRLPDLQASPGMLLLLGTTTYSRLAGLRDRFSIPQRLEIDFGRSGGKESFLPAWCYSLAPPLQEVSPELRSAAAIALDVHVDLASLVGLNPVACAIACGAAVAFDRSIQNLKPAQRDGALYFWKECAGEMGTLPAVYMATLSHFISALHTRTASNPVEVYRNSLFMVRNADAIGTGSPMLPSKGTAVPLAAYDPLATVDSLVSLLAELWEDRRDQLLKYRQWELRSGKILRARQKEVDRWDTVVAYCGGWDEHSAPCTRTPLVLGRHRTCDRCGYLICDKCGTCSRACGPSRARGTEVEF